MCERERKRNLGEDLLMPNISIPAGNATVPASPGVTPAQAWVDLNFNADQANDGVQLAYALQNGYSIKFPASTTAVDCTSTSWPTTGTSYLEMLGIVANGGGNGVRFDFSLCIANFTQTNGDNVYAALNASGAANGTLNMAIFNPTGGLLNSDRATLILNGWTITDGAT